MKKNNPGSQSRGELAIAELKKQRNLRRRAKRKEFVEARVKSLVLHIGQLQRQIKEQNLKLATLAPKEDKND
jgi:hypothetical protein